MALDFKNAYIRLKAGTKGGKGNVLDSGWGRKNAETWERLDADKVRRHLASGGNLAILTGARSGHFTVDVDPKNGGVETYDALKEEFGFPETNTVYTPSGGFHLNYAYPANFEVRNDTHGKVLGPGIDIKGAYGYRVAPGSTTPSGDYIEVVPGAPYAPAPKWLLKRLRAAHDDRAARVGSDVDGEGRLVTAARPSAPREAPEKVTDPPECCRSLSERATASLGKVLKRLAKAGEGERVEVLGTPRGWDEGFWLLGSRLVEVALWPWSPLTLEDAERLFFKVAPPAEGSYDPQHVWERAVETAEVWAKGTAHRIESHGPAVIEKATGNVVPPYSCNVNAEPYAFAEEMLDREFRDEAGRLMLRFRHDDRTFWLWSKRRRRYTMLTEDEVKARIARILAHAQSTMEDGSVAPVKVKARTYGEVVEVLRVLTLTSEHGAGALLPCVGGVPFRNGWLDARTGELVPITPDRDVRWNVPADYDALAECPNWLAFLDSLGWTEGTEERRLLCMWMGYLLSGRKEQEKAMLLLGPSRAGKGTIIRVCMRLLGDGATGTSLDSIMSNFGLQNFIGKGLATIGDARFGRSDKGLNAKLLSLTSNDELPVDVKYGKPLSLNLPVRLMIATNETPNFIEASDALAKRFVALVLDKSFAEAPDHGLYDRLRGEIPGIARWALEGLRDLDREGEFIETVKGKALQERMVRESAFVRLFVEECCVIDVNGKVATNDLYDEYAVWAEQNRMPVYNSVRFGRELLDAFPGVISNSTLRKGKTVVRAKFGVKLA